jgi:hypothetical protein
MPSANGLLHDQRKDGISVQSSRGQSRNFDYNEMSSCPLHLRAGPALELGSIAPLVRWHTPCEWNPAMNSIFYIIGVIVVIVVILKLLGLF